MELKTVKEMPIGFPGPSPEVVKILEAIAEIKKGEYVQANFPDAKEAARVRQVMFGYFHRSGKKYKVAKRGTSLYFSADNQ